MSETQSTLKPEDDAVWNDSRGGDVVLISSDNIAFHVPSYHLMSHSAVLRDALTIDKTIPSSSSEAKRIDLSDDECEAAESIRFFLHIITGGDIGQMLEDCPKTAVRVFLGTLLFCRKYDCPVVTQAIKVWLQRYVILTAHKSLVVTAVDVFVVACKLELYDLASDTLRYFVPNVCLDGEVDRDDPDRFCFEHYNKLHTSTLDPGDLCMMAQVELSRTVIFALCRAFRVGDTNDEIADMFDKTIEAFKDQPW
ncbi:hypothetical protein IAT38_003122 [Cryptococcus sp. DSM 104549]